MANNAFETPPSSPPRPSTTVNRTPTNANSRIQARRTPPPAPARPRRTGTTNVRRPTARRILFNGNTVSQNLRALLANVYPMTPRATTPKVRRTNTPPSSYKKTKKAKNKNNNKK